MTRTKEKETAKTSFDCLNKPITDLGSGSVQTWLTIKAASSPTFSLGGFFLFKLTSVAEAEVLIAEASISK